MTTALLSDPTLDALKRFEDPSLWVVRRAVPVLDVHEERDENGELLYEVTLDDLYEFAATGNRRERETGDCSLLVIGHLQKDQRDESGQVILRAHELSQPKRAGYARNWAVGQFGPQKKAALVAD